MITTVLLKLGRKLGDITNEAGGAAGAAIN
jgi:hypothetical protein